MAAQALLDGHFEAVGEGALDERQRLSLKKAVDVLRRRFGAEVLSRLRFTMATNEAGQILLTPESPVPTHEAWLYRNPAALEKVRAGLAQSVRREVAGRGSFAKYADATLDE